jgi:hypothetical protein
VQLQQQQQAGRRAKYQQVESFKFEATPPGEVAAATRQFSGRCDCSTLPGSVQQQQQVQQAGRQAGRQAVKK